jgi:hypothetical protein
VTTRAATVGRHRADSDPGSSVGTVLDPVGPTRPVRIVEVHVAAPELLGREHTDAASEESIDASEECSDVPPQFDRIEPVGFRDVSPVPVLEGPLCGTA